MFRRSPHSIVSILFLPAGIVLFWQAVCSVIPSAIWSSALPIDWMAALHLAWRVECAATRSEHLLAAALALFCPELARMAFVDLNNIALVRHSLAKGLGSRLSSDTPVPFEKAVSEKAVSEKAVSEALLEDSRLSHFYRTVISTVVLEVSGFYLALWSLPLGAIVIIFSQLWFNVSAKVQLWPHRSPAVEFCGIAQRWPVLVANAIGLLLMSLWFVEALRIWLGLGVLLLIALFLVLKYFVVKDGSGNA